MPLTQFKQFARTVSLRRAALRKLVSYVYAVLLGGVLIVSGTMLFVFVAGMIAGPPLGPQLADVAAGVLRRCMQIATVAVVSGMVYVYLSNKHTLTLRDANLVDSASSKRGQREADKALHGGG